MTDTPQLLLTHHLKALRLPPRTASLLCGGTPPCGAVGKPKPNKVAHFCSGQIQTTGDWCK